MVRVITILNPFDKRREVRSEEWNGLKTVKAYGPHGDYVYAINGIPVEPTTIPKDGDELVICPRIEGKGFMKIFGIIATIGLAVFTGGIGGGYIGASTMSVWQRMLAATLVSMIGNVVISKLSPSPRADKSDDINQSQTYGWAGQTSISSQGYPLPVLYGTMKTGGTILQRHIESEGTKQYLNLLYSLADGPIDKIENIQLNSNPIGNYSNVDTEKRYGTADQSIIPNFNDSYADTALAYELKPNNGWSTVTLNGNNANGIELTISFPQGLYYANDNGGMSRTKVNLEAQFRKVGATNWTNLPIANDSSMTTVNRRVYKINWNGSGFDLNSAETYGGSISLATNEAFYRVYSYGNLPSAQYEVRMRCTHKDGTSQRYANKVTWDAVTQVIYDDFIHPGKALLGIKALATDQLSGSDPSMTCTITRSKVWVWNPITNSYEQQPADNPAWACYDIIHQAKRYYENGKYVFEVNGADKSQMDYYQFKAWASMCEKNGNKFNYLYDSAMTIWDALAYPSRIGHGAVIIMGTKFSCIFDYAAESVQLFTVANIKKDTFKNEYQSTENRANAIEISFMNKDKNYERDVITVYSDDYDNSDSLTKPTQVELMGCTSAEQAYRYGKYYLRNNKYEIRTVEFEAFADAIACNMGDVITVQSDVTDWGTGGRVVSVKGNTVELDQPIDKSFTSLMFRRNDTDELVTTKITAVNGTKITVEDSTNIAKDCVYVVGKTGNTAKEFKVLTITKGMNEQTRKISAIEYYPEIYDESSDVLPAITTKVQTVDPPSDLLLYAKGFSLTNGDEKYVVTCSWNPPRSGDPVVLETALNDSAWVNRGKFSRGETSYSFEANANETYVVRIHAENDIGVRSAYVSNTINTSDGYSAATSVSKILATTRYRQTGDGGIKYAIDVSWEPSVKGAVYYKTNHISATQYSGKAMNVNPSTVMADAWTYAGEGIGQLTIPNAIVGDTYKIAVCTTDSLGHYQLPDNATSKTILVAIRTDIPNEPDGLELTFTDVVTATWEEVTNTDVAYYEVRTDTHAGIESDGLLGRTTGLKFVCPITNRKGTIYVYSRNTNGKYSTPAVVSYNKPAPSAPNLTATAIQGGMTLSVPYIPNGCLGVRYYVDGKELESVNSSIQYHCDPGIYDVQAAYFDLFGLGTKSGSKSVTVKIEIDESMLADESISKAKVDKAVQSALANGDYAKEHVDLVVGNLNKSPSESGYSAITQLAGDINLTVSTGDGKTSAINLTNKTITLDSKYLHITGKTVIDNNVITNGMLQAGAVTASKLSVDSLSAITANVGDLTGGTISGTTLIGSTIKNKDGSFTVDSNGNITGATLKAGTIDGSKVKINGYEVHSVAMIGGVASAYKFTIPLPSGYTEDQCVWGAYPAEYLGNYQIIFSGRIIGNEYGRTYMIDNGRGDAKAMKTFYWCIGIK